MEEMFVADNPAEKLGSKGDSGDKQAAGLPKRSTIGNFFRALKRVNEASVSENVRQRFSDYVTIGLVILCILSLLAAVSMQVPTGIRLLPLFFTIAAVIFYIINRLGIMVSFTHRQALIVWQILVAGFWLGVTSSMLIMLLVMYFFSRPIS
jgi:hypothetical protein